MNAPQGTLISFATASGKLAPGGFDGKSPYTKALAETIRKPGLDVFQAFNQVGLALAGATSYYSHRRKTASPKSGLPKSDSPLSN